MQRWNIFNEAIGQQECIQCPSSSAADLSPLSLKKRRVVLDDLSQSGGEISSLTTPANEVITVNFPQAVVAEERSNVEAVIQDSEKVGNVEVENDMMQKTQGAADRNERKHASSPTLGGLLTRGDVVLHSIHLKALRILTEPPS